MNLRRSALLIMAAIWLVAPCFVHAAADIRFGTLPVIQALPVFVAAEKGYFKEQGITVELVPFSSALEKDVAFTSGRISGYFGDIPTCMVLSGNRIPIKILAVVHNAVKGQRMFALVIAPKYAGRGLKDVVGSGVAVSSNTILNFLTARFFAEKGITAGQAKMVEIKNIPIRLQMLVAGQVAVAVLPEPLATLAEAKGAKPLMDDAGRGLSATVLAFGDSFIKEHPDRVKAFLRAVDKASGYINSNPEGARATMNRSAGYPIN